MTSNDKFELRGKSSREDGAIFGQIIDRLLAGEVLDVRRLREEYPDMTADVLEQLRAYQDMLPRENDGPSASTLGDYTIVRQVGRGGMGIVYEAWQNSINRRVALKVLPVGVAADSRTMARFVREAHISGKMKHPHIVSVYGMGVEAQTPYYAMEFVDGQTLASFLSRQRKNGPRGHIGGFANVTADPKTPEACVNEPDFATQPTALDADYCLRVAREFIGVAHGLHHAHQQGVIHRDIKPSNLMMEASETGVPPRSTAKTPEACVDDSIDPSQFSGRIRILDFGLARCAGGESLTMTGDIVGTVTYMSPEQARSDAGAGVDHRTDIYSLGATLYETLTLRPPVKGRTSQDTLSKILSEEPVLPRGINPNVPRDLETIVLQCLRKDPTDRYSDARAVALDLERFLRGDPLVARPQSTLERIARRSWRNRRLVSIVTVISTAILALIWFSRSQQRARQDLVWVQRAIPQVQECLEQRHYVDAFQLLKRAGQLAPDDSTIKALQRSITGRITVATDPPGAKVSIREYGKLDGAWLELGHTPFEAVEAPAGDYCWKFEHPSAGTQCCAREIVQSEDLTFDFEFSPPSGPNFGMKQLKAGEYLVSIQVKDEVERLSGFWMDQREVSNGEYQQFVDAGGYERSEFWPDEFELAGSILPFESAVDRFRDSTGFLGPSTWISGKYPRGTADRPVAGVSWYEAGAYARFCQKSLPTVYHWRAAAELHEVREIAPYSPGKMSNIDTKALAPVGKYPALTQTGLQDTIGNVKEWCTNREVKSNKRFALGGSWRDPAYSYAQMVSFSAWTREPTIGFRCVRYSTEGLPPKLLSAVKVQFPVDYRRRAPVSNLLVKSYEEQHYGYTRGELNPAVEKRVRETDSAMVEKITINTAYGERFSCLLYLPKGFKRPLQAMIYGGHNGFWHQKDLMDVLEQNLESPYLLDSGRAVLVPALFGHFQRTPGISAVDGELATREKTRDRRIRQVQDVMRLIDYVETRSDLDSNKLGYIAASSGAQKAPIVLAVEDRLRLGVLTSGGLASYEVMECCDPFNFAPHVTQPVLMLNGEDDSVYNLEQSQRLLFDLLGTAPEHKTHRVYPGDHGFEYRYSPQQTQQVRNAIVKWLDEKLGVPGKAAVEADIQ